MKLKAIASLLLLASASLSAQTVAVTDAWARSTVPGQQATGVFMKITAKEGARLVAVSTPVAGVAEVHEMKMQGEVMTMRALPAGLDLPAGKTVELKPGGYHLMLMDLKGALPRGARIALTLVLRDGKGVQSKLELKVPVEPSAPVGQAGDKASHEHRQH